MPGLSEKSVFDRWRVGNSLLVLSKPYFKADHAKTCLVDPNQPLHYSALEIIIHARMQHVYFPFVERV